MGDEFGKKIGASILIAVMLLASFGIIGLGVSSELAVQEEVKASGPIQGLKALELDSVLQASMRDNIPRLAITERTTPQSAPPLPEVNGLYPVVDTTRCVLAEFGSGIDNGSFVPSYLYALDQTMNSYSRSEVAPMQLNADANSLFGAPGYRDLEYSPGDSMYGGMCDAAGRQFDVPPYGLDIYGAYGDPLTGGSTVVNTGIWAVDGQYSYGDGGDTFYNDGDSSWDGRWDDAGGSGALCVQPAIDARLGDPSDFTMTLNGTFNDVSDWANVSLQISAINDMDGYDPSGFTIFFWFVDDYNVVEQRTNAYENDGSATDGPSTKNYVIRNSMQKYVGLDEDMTGFLDSRGDTIYYQDIAFGREPISYPYAGMPKEWNGAEAGMICSIADGTGQHLQTVYYQFEGTEADLAITPVDIFYDTAIEVINETVYGPSAGGEMGPIYLANGDVFDCTMYVDIGGEWYWLEEDSDYFFDPVTGEVDISPIAPMEAGWTFYAYYNYSSGVPSVGDTVPFDITISNAGNGAANAVVVGLYDGDPTNGGVLIDTHAAGNIAGNTAYNFVYNWDTTGYEGFHSFCVVPDYTDAIAESNENNNIASHDIYIAPPDDVGVFDLLTFEDGMTYEYGFYDIEAIIGNYGTTSQPPFDVNCQVEHLGTAVYLLNDNVEGGALPGWTADAGWSILGTDSHSPANSWECTYAASMDSKLTFGPFDLSGAFASASWSWWHTYSYEAGWDGGVVEVSADGAAWTRLTPANGYDGALGTGYGNVLEGETTYTGAVGWVQDSCDLTAYLGDTTVWVRYWYATDSWEGGGTGWFVDDVMISKITAGLGVLYDVTQPTTMNPMNQWDSELLTWNYNFDMEAMYRVSVTTLLGSDVVTTNDQIMVDITMANIRAPFPPTDLTSQAGGAGTTFYQETSSDILVNNGGIVNSHTATHMPADAVSEEITEGSGYITGTTEYTYNGITGPSGTHIAYRCEVDAMPPDGSSVPDGPFLNSQDEATTAQYGEITDSEDTRWITADPGNGDENFMQSEFQIAENVADITEIVISYEGQGNAATNFDLWVIDSGTWTDTGTTVACPADTDSTVIHSFTSNFANIVIGGTLTWGAYQTDASDLIRSDKMNVTVRYQIPSGNFELDHQWQLQNVPAGDTHMLYATVGYSGGDDNYEYYFSSTGAFAGEETLMFTDTTAGLNQLSYDLGAAYTGALYVQVIDTNTGDASEDVVYVDEMYVETVITTSPNDLLLTWTLSPDDGAGSNDVQGYNIYKADAASGEFYEGPYSLYDTVGAGTNMYPDVGAMLVADNAWYYIEVTDPMYASTVTGIVSKYDPMPLTANLLADGVNPWTGPVGTLSLTLTGTIRDNTTTNEYNTLVTGAEWYDTIDPGEGLGTPFALPVDGTWDGPYEGINQIIDTSAWGAGIHTIYVRGNSDTGWGTPVGIDVTLTAPTYDIDLVGVLADEWVFISFPIEVSGNIETILDDSILGDGGTTWDVAKWYDVTDPADPWKTHRIGAPGNDLITIDNTRGVWLHITVNGGNNALTLGQMGGYPVVAVGINLEIGWNLVSYPSASPIDADATLPVEADFIAEYNDALPYLIEDFAVAPGAVTMSEGNAYWVHVSGSSTIWNVAP